MEVRFLDENVDIKNLTGTDLSGINQFLLENNKKQLEKLFEFYCNKPPLMLVNGFLGTGKTQIINHFLHFLSNESIILKYNCFETTILDDILLSFFEDFKNLTMKNIIQQPKIKTENFTQKIASYFNTINKPVTIVINSFESILKDNKQEILDFIFHLTKKENIKIIIIGRTFNYEDFIDKVSFERITILALEKNLFEKFLRSEGIKMIGPVSDELYKHTRGYYFYTKLSTKIINTHHLTLFDFLNGFTKSFLSYSDFILREALALVDPVSGHLFRLLTILRHPVSLNLLKTINLYNEDKINFFIDNLILSKEKDMIYLQDYYKDISMNSIPENVAIKLHKACVDLYTTQLPLKPFERDLLISRQTMRSEIEYHSLFIPKKAQFKPLNETTMEAMEYSADSNCNYQLPESDNIPQPLIDKYQPENKDEQIKNISFIFDSEEDENKIMSGIADSINKFIDYSNKILTPEETKLPVLELMNKANRAENEFNFKKALAYYQMALTLKDDTNFPTMVSRIYTQMAICYENLSDWFNALKYYDMAFEYYTNAADMEKLNEIRLAIANIFYITFKHDKAKLLLEDILNSKENISDEVKIKAHIAMANICNDDIKTAYNNYKSALELSRPTTDKKILAELYFKFAVVCDDIDEPEASIRLYKRCLDITKDNPYQASAMFNLAEIFEETGAEELAVKYYKESLKIDETNNNNNGIYISSIKLAQLFRIKNREASIKYLEQSVQTAKKLKEPYYIMDSNIKLGDFHILNRDFKAALKSYLTAMNSNDKMVLEDKEKIERRIQDLKVRLGFETFENLKNEITNEQRTI